MCRPVDGVLDKVASELLPIAILGAVIAIVVTRLPRVQLGHTPAFRRRRTLNWVPLGLTYAFLYMGRYNLVSLKDPSIALISNKEFGDIDAWGSIVYGLAFLFNGPLTDRLGGRFAILVAAAGAGACNFAIGAVMVSTGTTPSYSTLMLLFCLNMYFQSFGAVSIVKVNASWFHLRERGTFGGIFGILISLGLYFAFDWAPKIASLTTPAWLFLTPALILFVFFALCTMIVRDTPAEAGLPNFDVADASSGDDGPAEPPLRVIGRLLTNRVILTIAFISLCSGFLRQGILKWYRTFADGVHLTDTWVFAHWGMVSCAAGMTGGMFAGIISDHVFHSRRPPVSVVLFAVLLCGASAIMALLAAPEMIPWVIVVMAMAVIGVHGMLSGVASQDFGGRRNAGTATGLIDGFVYFGTALQGFVYGALLPETKIVVDGKSVPNPDAGNIDAWSWWPRAMIPMAIIGLALSVAIYRAVVVPRAAGVRTSQR
jgi:OPA family glycerol-3-phosphate transporter-like MFS transporter